MFCLKAPHGYDFPSCFPHDEFLKRNLRVSSEENFENKNAIKHHSIAHVCLACVEFFCWQLQKLQAISNKVFRQSKNM